MDILDPDLAGRIGALGVGDADGVSREACALFAAGYGRRDARDLARALHWVLRGNPLVCSSPQIVHVLANAAGGALSAGPVPGGPLRVLSAAQCAALGVALDLGLDLDRGTARADGSTPAHGATADLTELLTLGRRLALALELLRRPDYFLSELYRGEEVLIG